MKKSFKWTTVCVYNLKNEGVIAILEKKIKMQKKFFFEKSMVLVIILVSSNPLY